MSRAIGINETETISNLFWDSLCGRSMILQMTVKYNYPPKLSYMIELSSTPRSVSMATTALLIGPGPHM